MEGIRNAEVTTRKTGSVTREKIVLLATLSASQDSALISIMTVCTSSGF